MMTHWVELGILIQKEENVTQITVYPKECTIFVTMEPELSIKRKLEIVTKIKKMTPHL